MQPLRASLSRHSFGYSRPGSDVRECRPLRPEWSIWVVLSAPEARRLSSASSLRDRPAKEKYGRGEHLPRPIGHVISTRDTQ